jgi:mono/diheme cytochrome c family protein
MTRIAGMALVLGGAVLALSCGPPHKSSAGFHIPDGDVAAGQAAFVELKCSSCHEVKGVDLPPPVATPPVPVVLGGETPRTRTDGELVAAIVDPSHKLAPAYPRDKIKSGNLSRMGDFADAMTVRELIDIVAFLQAHYQVVAPPVPVHH